MSRVWVRRRWFWWTAFNPDEPLATMDCNTYFRSLSREKAIAKCQRHFAPRESRWEEIRKEDNQ